MLGYVTKLLGSILGKSWMVQVAVERKGFCGCWKGLRDSAAGVGGGGVNWSFKTGVVAVDERAASLYACAMVAAGASGEVVGRDSVASPRANTWTAGQSLSWFVNSRVIQRERFSSGRK